MGYNSYQISIIMIKKLKPTYEQPRQFDVNAIEQEIELRDGLWWPVSDYGCYKFLRVRQNVPELISRFVLKHNVVVQAGGMAGMYPRFYQEIFDTVYTFEPDPINFHCLVRNTDSNVIKTQACVGDRPNLVTMSYDESIGPVRPNRGGLFVKGTGVIPTYTIDSLGLEQCDLIHLDVEGSEGFALQGAEQTIQRYKPVIALEMYGHGEKFGWSDQRLHEMLLDWGYHYIVDVCEDRIYCPEKIEYTLGSNVHVVE